MFQALLGSMPCKPIIDADVEPLEELGSSCVPRFRFRPQCFRTRGPSKISIFTQPVACNEAMCRVILKRFYAHRDTSLYIARVYTL